MLFKVWLKAQFIRYLQTDFNRAFQWNHLLFAIVFSCLWMKVIPAFFIFIVSDKDLSIQRLLITISHSAIEWLIIIDWSPTFWFIVCNVLVAATAVTECISVLVCVLFYKAFLEFHLTFVHIQFKHTVYDSQRGGFVPVPLLASSLIENRLNLAYLTVLQITTKRK